jgi:3-methyladenine DNA glycosylase/8-oxoguanine DNA glycosylase
VRSVLGQQVSVAAARTLFLRLAGRCGAQLHGLTPQALMAADLSAIGMPGRRVASLLALARAVAEDGLQLEGRDWAQTDEALRRLPGFGPWTRAYLAIRLGRQADAFPESDLGLMRAAGADSPAALLKMAERWRPWRAHAAIHLWNAQRA